MAHKNKKSNKKITNFGLLSLGALGVVGNLAAPYNVMATDNVKSFNFVKNDTQFSSAALNNPDRGVYEDLYFSLDMETNKLWWTTWDYWNSQGENWYDFVEQYATYRRNIFAAQSIADLSSHLNSLDKSMTTVGLHFNIFEFFDINGYSSSRNTLEIELKAEALNTLQNAMNIIREHGFKVILMPAFNDMTGRIYRIICWEGIFGSSCYDFSAINSSAAINAYEEATTLLKPFFDKNEDIISFVELDAWPTIENTFNANPMNWEDCYWQGTCADDFPDTRDLMAYDGNTEMFYVDTFASQYSFLMDAVPQSKAIGSNVAEIINHYANANFSISEPIVPFSGSPLSRMSISDAQAIINLQDHASSEFITSMRIGPHMPYTGIEDLRFDVPMYDDPERETATKLRDLYALSNGAAIRDMTEMGYASVMSSDLADILSDDLQDSESVLNKLGYRLAVDTVDFDISNGSMTAQVVLNNDGYGYLVNEKDVKLLLVDEDKKYSINLDADIRKLVNYRTNKYTLDFSSDIPEDLASGEYQIYLQIAEPYETLKDHDNYFIKLANTNTYDADQHANLLGVATIEVSEPEPEPEPDPDPGLGMGSESEISIPNTGMINDQNSLIALVAGSSIIAGALIKYAMQKQRKPKLGKRK